MPDFDQCSVQVQGNRLVAVEHARTMPWFRDAVAYLARRRPALPAPEEFLAGRLLDCPEAVLLVLNRTMPEA